jgi:hypothetical protein
MSKQKQSVLIVLILVATLALAGAAFAATPEQEIIAASNVTPALRVYPPLEADFSIYDWRKSETPRDLIGTMTVYARGGDGHYTFEFIGLHDTNTFDFRWRACSVLVNSLRVRSGDGQQIDLPVWRDGLPCPKHWRGEEDN